MKMPPPFWYPSAGCVRGGVLQVRYNAHRCRINPDQLRYWKVR